MKLLDRWPDRTKPLEKGDFVLVWALWLSGLVTVVQGLQQHVQFGSGDPEGVVTAAQGTLFLRDDGGAGTTAYAKTTGGTDPATLTDTGWVAL